MPLLENLFEFGTWDRKESASLAKKVCTMMRVHLFSHQTLYIELAAALMSEKWPQSGNQLNYQSPVGGLTRY